MFLQQLQKVLSQLPLGGIKSTITKLPLGGSKIFQIRLNSW